MRVRGFTLMEMLVALGIFAIIGVISSQLLRQTIEVSDVLIDKGDRLVEIQRAMNVMSRDFLQIVNRSVRDEFGEPMETFIVDQFGALQFTRNGWSNLLNKPRSTLQRVGYAFENGTLIRKYWPVLDRTETTEPINQELLADVEIVEFVVIDTTGLDHVSWPPLTPPIEGEEPPKPAAIQMTMSVLPIGDITRLWIIPQMPQIVEIHEMTGPGDGRLPPIFGGP